MFALYFLFHVLLVIFFHFADAFSFTAGTLSECDDFQVQWSGGTGPYQLLIIPSFGTPRNFSIPDSAYVGGQGSFSTQMNLPQGQKLVLTMSDATGFGSGGTTDVLTVQPSQGGACDTADPGVAFPFELNSALQQCRPFVFSGYSGAVQPVTIRIVIPAGTSLILSPPLGSQTYSWMANVAQGTSMMFMMTDAKGNQGGSSDIRIVGASDDITCLNAQSPSSTSIGPSSTPSATKTGQAAIGSGTAPPASTAAAGVPISAIAGTVIGAFLFLAVIVTLGLFFLRRRRENLPTSNTSIRRQSRRLHSDSDFFDSSRPPNVHPYGLSPHAGGSPYYPHSPNSTLPFENPFLDSSSPQHHSPLNYQQTSSQYPHDPFRAQPAYYPPPAHVPDPALDPFNSSGPPVLPGATFEPLSMDTTEQTASQRKAVMAGISAYKPARFIVHTDVEDDLPPPNDDGVVELPPQYSERRGPLNIANPSPPSPSATAPGHRSEYPLYSAPPNVSPYS